MLFKHLKVMLHRFDKTDNPVSQSLKKRSVKGIKIKNLSLEI
jgi:hypothetical protein